MRFPDYKEELKKLKAGYEFIVGCDEAGRGPLAGPVVAAACILNPKTIGASRTKNKWYARVRDSKTIPEEEREMLYEKILENSFACGIGEVDPKEIDKLNIHNASLLAMKRAVEDVLSKIPKKYARKIFILVDGRFTIPEMRKSLEQKSIIGGDAKVLSIAAASIIAKVHRDRIMKKLDSKFPAYGFKKHKGYGTNKHYEAIKKLGLTAFHRKTFISST